MPDLQELFARDPLNHTTDSIDELIGQLRGMRGQFVTANDTKAGKVRAPAKPKTTTLGAAGISLNLGSMLDKKL